MRYDVSGEVIYYFVKHECEGLKILYNPQKGRFTAYEYSFRRQSLEFMFMISVQPVKFTH